MSLYSSGFHLSHCHNLKLDTYTELPGVLQPQGKVGLWFLRRFFLQFLFEWGLEISKSLFILHFILEVKNRFAVWKNFLKLNAILVASDLPTKPNQNFFFVKRTINRISFHEKLFLFETKGQTYNRHITAKIHSMIL